MEAMISMVSGLGFQDEYRCNNPAHEALTHSSLSDGARRYCVALEDGE